jgi:cytochrome c oxidase subunit 3
MTTETLATEPTHSTLQHQFEDAHQQKDAVTLGMWTFLATEVLFFGAVVVSYGIYRHMYPDGFRQGSLDLKWYLGCINTAVLLFSSFFMAMAVHSAALGHADKIVRYLWLTIFVAIVFLVIKGTEYYIDFDEHLVPGSNFSITPPEEADHGALVRGLTSMEHALGKSPAKEEHLRDPHEQLFFLFYFILTGIHATHMIIGIGIMLVLIWMSKQGRFSAGWHNPVEMTGLYWHFVDIVWVFLFPILYLLRNP